MTALSNCTHVKNVRVGLLPFFGKKPSMKASDLTSVTHST